MLAQVIHLFPKWLLYIDVYTLAFPFDIRCESGKLHMDMYGMSGFVAYSL